MPNETLVSLDLPGLTKLRSGKVREIFDLGDTLLFVATDRLSAGCRCTTWCCQRRFRTKARS